jgi:signal transduction histidine kinase
MDRTGENHSSSKRLLGPMVLLFVVAVLVAISAANAADEERAKRVLMISTGSRFSPGFGILEENIVDTLRRLAPARIEFYSEYLDIVRFPGESYQRLFRDYLHEKYADQTPDLIVLNSVGNFVVAEKFLRQLFPGVRVFLAGLTEEDVSTKQFGSDVSGIVQRMDLSGTMELILRLQPETRRVLVISGVAEIDRITLARAQAAARSFANRIDFEFWSDRSMADVRQAVQKLPAKTAILLTRMYRDAAGEAFIPPQAAQLIAQAANAPLYVLGAASVGGGAVGGAVTEAATHGKEAGEFAARILYADSTAAFPLIVRTEGVPMFDSRALRQWGISQSRLPPGSVVRFRPTSMWEQYRWYVTGALVIIALQALLIGSLLLQRARRRRAEREAASLAGRLITAHEDERRRLARDLHDDLTQRLARLAIDAGNIERSAPASNHDESRRSMREGLVHLSEDVHALSYRLHPSLLDDLGLVEALNAECDAFSRRESIPVEFKPRDVPRDVASETALCLFRIAQESLHNVARHAGASAVEVSLRKVDEGLEMAVSDNGTGFNPAENRARPSLGLASMKERVHLLGGELDIESASGQGTTVVAWVRLNGEETS